MWIRVWPRSLSVCVHTPVRSQIPDYTFVRISPFIWPAIVRGTLLFIDIGPVYLWLFSLSVTYTRVGIVLTSKQTHRRYLWLAIWNAAVVRCIVRTLTAYACGMGDIQVNSQLWLMNIKYCRDRNRDKFVFSPHHDIPLSIIHVHLS